MGNKYSKANIKNQVREAIIANTLTEKKTEKIVSVLAKLFIDTEMGYQWDDGELAATIEKVKKALGLWSTLAVTVNGFWSPRLVTAFDHRGARWHIFYPRNCYRRQFFHQNCLF